MSAKPPQSAEEHRRQGKNLQLTSLFYAGRQTLEHGSFFFFFFFCLVPEVYEEHVLVAASTFPQRVLLANLLWFLDVACCFWRDKEIKSCYTTIVGFRCLDIVQF